MGSIWHCAFDSPEAIISENGIASGNFPILHFTAISQTLAMLKYFVSAGSIMIASAAGESCGSAAENKRKA